MPTQGKHFDRLVETSKANEVPVVRCNCWHDSIKTQSRKKSHAPLSHFDSKWYKTTAGLCVSARAALRNWNILLCVELYNGSIGTLVDIVYRNNLIGSKKKQHNYLQDCIVIKFPHLSLSSHIEP